MVVIFQLQLVQYKLKSTLFIPIPRWVLFFVFLIIIITIIIIVIVIVIVIVIIIIIIIIIVLGHTHPLKDGKY